MLKSTHRPLQAPQPPPLPSPWTEHKAPSGHAYYYNPETKQSTYTRPVAEPPQPPASAPQPLHYNPAAPGGWSTQAPQADYISLANGAGTRPPPNQRRHHRPDDRPKTKYEIPGHAPWLLIKTRLRRRFVYNPETRESLWKIPADLIQGLVEFDIQEREKKERKERGEEEEVPLHTVLGGEGIERREHDTAKSPEHGRQQDAGKQSQGEVSGDEEYEEVEVTDSEYESDGHPPKRRKTSPAPEAEGAEADEEPDYMIEEEDEEEATAQAQNDELGEDDMAAQLAAMGQDYDLDPTEYYHEDGEEGEAYELTQEEAEASFRDMLDDHAINPYSTWENLIAAEHQIISDDRYTLLTSMSARRKLFAQWSADRIAAQQLARENQVKSNPRIPYLQLLENHANPKLFWAEFKRKWKKEPEMRDSKISDKEREKLYRDFITRTTKMAESARKEDLMALMKSLEPSPSWNRACSIDGLMPDALLADIRFVTLPAKVRDPMVASFVEGLSSAEEVADMDGMSEEEKRKRVERQKRDEAVRKRGREVEAKKREQEKELQYGQRRLQAEERELERAQKVGVAGLMDALQP